MANIAEEWHDFYVLKCPHCSIGIIIHKTELNCRIFRCNPELQPHASIIECQIKYNEDKTQGCCQPFRINDDLSVEKCDYL